MGKVSLRVISVLCHHVALAPVLKGPNQIYQREMRSPPSPEALLDVRWQGFAYVDFGTPEALETAVARSGQLELRGFRLAVAVSAPPGSGRGRGRGDRGGGQGDRGGRRGGFGAPRGRGAPQGGEGRGGEGFYGGFRGGGRSGGGGGGGRGGGGGGRGGGGLEPMDARKGADHHRQHLDVGGGGGGGRAAGQTALLPRSLTAKPAGPAGGGSGGGGEGGAAGGAPKSNADFRKMLLDKK